MINALKPSFFRPTSRPSSPAPVPPSRPDSGVGFEKAGRPLNMLSLPNFRRPLPPLGPTSAGVPTPLIQDGSYLEMLGLKLSEAVSKALAQPTGPAAANEQLAGRHPIPAGRGHTLGALIASELQATCDNPHLRRAAIRCLHRPLSVLLTNLSGHLLPLLSTPAFLSPPAPTSWAPNPNPTQIHALALATFAGEVLESLDDLGLGTEGDFRGDGLRLIREGLVSLVGRVVNPLIGGIKNELMPLIEALENPNLTVTSIKPATGPKSVILYHPSIVALQATMPIYARALSRYTTSVTSQSILTTFLISVIWRALVALSHRPPRALTPPASPTLSTPGPKKRNGSTPPVTPPAGRFAMKLPPSRPPSPPAAQVPASAAADARALYDLLNLFPKPAENKESTRLAREAVDEAFVGLHALPALLEDVQVSLKPDDALLRHLEALTADLPTLIALPLLLRAFGAGESRSVAAMLGLSEDEYRRGCLAGFGRAEECATIVGQRVIDVLRADRSHELDLVARWLEEDIDDDE